MRVRGWDVRAFDVFRVSLAVSFVSFLAFMLVSMVLKLLHGGLTAAESGLLLGLLYWGTYPLVFVALGSLLWHFVAFYKGAYAGR